MTRDQQLKFVSDLTHAVAKHVMNKITAGDVPATWDGVELRQLLADKFAWETFAMSPKRKREYRNTVAVNNL